MIDETERTDVAALSPRAGVALLSLQLRGTLHDAEAAEAEAASIDTDAALWQLRSRLGPLVDDRRRALAAELEQERAAADERVAAARADADRIVADAHRAAEEGRARRAAAAEEARARSAAAAEQARALRAAEEEERARQAAAEEEERFRRADADDARDAALTTRAEEAAALLAARAASADAATKPELFDDQEIDAPPADPPVTPADDVTGEPADDVLLVEADDAPLDPLVAGPVHDLPRPGSAPPPPPVPLAAPTPPTPSPATIDPPADEQPPGPAATQIVIDADSFAKAFAAAMAPVVEARDRTAHQQVLPPYLPPTAVPMNPVQPEPKRSFWSNAWHPDVLLSGLAMVIVVVVLIAWTG